MKDLPLFIVDAFSSCPFQGNPAAVCLLHEKMEKQWMQKVAREMNLSETAFLLQKGKIYSLRWFTPAVEVDLCGHATLASAHVLWEENLLEAGEAALFDTRSGRLSANLHGDWIELDFPARPEKQISPPEELADALGTKLVYTGRSLEDYQVEVESESILREIKPDFEILSRIDARGIIVTSRSKSPDFDFVSRFFAPACGINEDPVTGSAHSTLGPFWGGRLGKKELTGYQASARGGLVRVRLGDERVFIGGQAVTVVRGRLLSGK